MSEVQKLMQEFEKMLEGQKDGFPSDISTILYQPNDADFALKLSTDEFGIIIQPLYQGQEGGGSIQIQPEIIPALLKALPIFAAQQKRITESI